MEIVLLDRYSLGEADLSAFAALGNYTAYDNSQQSQVVARCSDADVIITNKVKIMRAEMDALPNLKLICVAATGTNNVDMDYAALCGIKVRNVPAYSTQSVAEATLSMVLALLRNTLFYDEYAKRRYAASDRCFNLDRPISQVSSKRWGIIGMGNIGRRVAELATAFGASVCYYSTSGKNPDAGYERATLQTLLATCDIVSIHCPLNEQTQHLIAGDELRQMKPTAIVVNVGRGGIIAETDLAQALDNGTIAGAALDVFGNEPIEVGNPLLSIRDPYRLVVAPHCAWSSAEARSVLVEKIAHNIRQFFENQVKSHL